MTQSPFQLFQRGEEVACRPVLLVLEEASRRGIPAEAFLDGTGLTSDALEDPSARIAWPAFVRFLENAERRIGREGLAKAGRSSPSSGIGQFLAVRVARLRDAADLYRPLAHPATNFVEMDYECLRTRLSEPGPGRFELEVRYAEGYEACAPLHSLLRGGLEAAPVFVGLPTANVAVTPQAGGAHFAISLPPLPRGPLGRLRRAFRRWRNRYIPAEQVAGLLRELQTRERLLSEAVERGRREQSARAASESRFTQVFHASPAASSLMRVSDRKLVDVNEAYLRLVGLQRDQVLGLDAALVPWCKREEIARIGRESERDPQFRRLPFTVLRPDGGARSAVLSREPITVDGEPYVIWQAEDVTDLERASEVLREAEQTYFDLYENAPDMYALVDLETGRLQRCNRKLCETTGLTRAGLLERRLDQLLDADPPGRLGPVLGELLRTGSLRNQRLVLRRERGDTVDVSVSGSAVRGSDGKVRQTRLILRNLGRPEPDDPD